MVQVSARFLSSLLFSAMIEFYLHFPSEDKKERGHVVHDSAIDSIDLDVNKISFSGLIFFLYKLFYMLEKRQNVMFFNI